MAGRKIRDAADARACLAAAKRARRLSLLEWAHKHEIDGRSLNAWRMNLTRRAGEKAPRRPRRTRQPAKQPKPRLVELVAEVPSPPSRYVVRCGQVSVELDDRFDETTLRRLLEVLTRC